VLRIPTLAAIVLTACVPSSASTFRPVGTEVQRRLGVEADWRTTESDGRVPAAIAARLAQPLDRDAVVRIAIATNRHLQADYERLGVAAAAIASATVLRPTEIDFDVKYASKSGGETEVTAVQDVLDLIQIGQRRGTASAELEAAQRRAVASTVTLATRAERAFYDAVAAEQEVALRRTALDAASASAEIAERQHAAHNVSDLVLAREQAQREDAEVALRRAEADAQVAHDALAAVLGVADAQSFTVIDRLPDVPDRPPTLDDLERAAVGDNLELAALRADADAAESRARVARLRAWLPEVAIGAAGAKREGGDWEIGPALRIGLPIFDQQQGPRAAANAERRRAEHELAATAIDLGARAQAAKARALATYDEARRMKDVVLPLRKRVLDETLLQYNAMNASSFELLAARRDQVEAGRAYIDALRRYWRAMAEVEALRAGAMPDGETP
jgi:cobalt-zinc-cadmium efflux system outer membrane protein